MAVRSEVIESFRHQAEWGRTLHSPFSGAIFERATAALEAAAGGAVRAGEAGFVGLVGAWPGEPIADALPLRFLGALHALALGQIDADIVAAFPGGRHGAAGNPDAAWRAALDAIGRLPQHFNQFLAGPPQTNEVGRSAVLLGGFLEIAAATGRPFRTLEIGASAGFNSAWDRYRYALAHDFWGPPESPLRIETQWSGPLPRLDAHPEVIERKACDRNPIDLEEEGERLRLRSYVWPDQPERLARLDAAIAIARRSGVRVERADAAEWLMRELAQPSAACGTVVFHSIVWQYLTPETKTRIRALIEAAGAAATADRPLAWLRMEPAERGKPFALKLGLWPGARHAVLAEVHPHGASVHWLGARLPER